MSAASPGRIPEIIRYVRRQGFLGFGGLVALVGQMERELVAGRGWLSQGGDARGHCPRPGAPQVLGDPGSSIYLSHLRGGFWGAWAGGWAFILPNFLIVAALGALYMHRGDLKAVTAIFYGVSPAVIALILHSCYCLVKLGMEDRLPWAGRRRLRVYLSRCGCRP